MQVSCFAFNWQEVLKRPDAAAIVDEMIATDDIDIYATSLPEGLWPSDSAMLHFAVASALSDLASSPAARLFPGIDLVAQLISDKESIDELGLSPLTDGAYFVSLSPARVAELSQSFSQLQIDSLAEHCSKAAGEPAAYIAQWLTQWRDALAFAQARGLGLIGHCG